MKNIGKFLQVARNGKGLSLKDLSALTKIKPEIISYIEESNWEKLPELPVLTGFVKNISDALDLNKEAAVALLRRDYPPKKLNLNPSPDIRPRFSVGPKTIIVFFVGFLLLIFGGYLFYQYRVFVSPPKLSVISPSDGEVVNGKELNVRGSTDSNASVLVNNQPANVDDDGNFTSLIEVIPDTKEVTIKAVSRSGRESTITRNIKVEQK